MIDHKDIIERLEQQNNWMDTTEAQREANKLRIQWLNWLNKEKPQVKHAASTDILMEAHKQSGYRCTPRSLL